MSRELSYDSDDVDLDDNLTKRMNLKTGKKLDISSRKTQCPICLKAVSIECIDEHIQNCQIEKAYADVNNIPSSSQSSVRVHFQEGKTEISKVTCPKCQKTYYPWTIKKHVLNCSADMNPFKLCKYCSKKIHIKNLDRHTDSCKKSMHVEKRKVEIDEELRRLASECMDIPDEDVVFSDKEDELDFILYSDPNGKTNSASAHWDENSARARDENFDSLVTSESHYKSPSKVMCPTCGQSFSHDRIRKHLMTCEETSAMIPCRYCFKKVNSLSYKRHLSTCKEYYSQSRSSFPLSRDLTISKNEAKVIDITADGEAVEDSRRVQRFGKDQHMCVECETKFSDKKQLNEHLIVSHKYQWRTKFSDKAAFTEWFCRKKFDQTMSRIEQASTDGCTQEGYRCTSAVKGFSRCGCRLTVRFSEVEVVARYVDIHSHPVVHYKRRLSQGCRQMLIKMLQDGLSNEEVIVEARKKVDPRSVDHSLITRKNLNSLRYHHIKRYWHFDEIDLDRLGNAALEEEQAKSRSQTEERLRKILDDESDGDQGDFVMDSGDVDSDDDRRPSSHIRASSEVRGYHDDDSDAAVEKQIAEDIIDVCQKLNKDDQITYKKREVYSEVDYDDLALGDAKEDVFPTTSRTYTIVDSGVEVQNEDGEEFIEVEVEELDDDANDDGGAVVYLNNEQIAYVPTSTADHGEPETKRRHVAGKERSVRFAEPPVQEQSEDVEAVAERKWRGEFSEDINDNLGEELGESRDAAIQSEPLGEKVKSHTMENIVQTILPCLQRAMHNPNVSEKRLRIIRSQLTDMIVDLQPRHFLDDDDNFLPVVSEPRKRGRPKGSGKGRGKRPGTNS